MKANAKLLVATAAAAIALGRAAGLLSLNEPEALPTFLVFLAAMIIPLAMPDPKCKPRAPTFPIAVGVLVSLAIGIAMLAGLEQGRPFAAMANLTEITEGLHLLILLWSVVVIVSSLFPSWRANARYLIFMPVLNVCCMVIVLWTY